MGGENTDPGHLQDLRKNVEHLKTNATLHQNVTKYWGRNMEKVYKFLAQAFFYIRLAISPMGRNGAAM